MHDEPKADVTLVTRRGLHGRMNEMRCEKDARSSRGCYATRWKTVRAGTKGARGDAGEGAMRRRTHGAVARSCEGEAAGPHALSARMTQALPEDSGKPADARQVASRRNL